MSRDLKTYQGLIGLARLIQTVAKLQEIDTSITWDKIESYDRIIPPGTRRILDKIESLKLPRCEFLRKNGDYFYFCGINLPENLKPKHEFLDPMYHAHVKVSEILHHCRNEFESCPFYKNSKSES